MKKLNSAGIAHLAILIAVGAVMVIGGVGALVINANRNNNEQANIAQSDQNNTVDNADGSLENEDSLQKIDGNNVAPEGPEEEKPEESPAQPEKEPTPVPQPAPVVEKPQPAAPDNRPNASTCDEKGYDSYGYRYVKLYVSNPNGATLYGQDETGKIRTEQAVQYKANYGEQYEFTCNNYVTGEPDHPYYCWDGCAHRDDLSTVKP